MKAQLQAWAEALADQFWLLPAICVAVSIVAAELAIYVEQLNLFGSGPGLSKRWIYSGGTEGARALLGAVASSSIGVASTVFSVTIAALSLASGQMGPRLLRNFVRDRRNQLALGIFLGTFAYALLVLRTIRAEQQGTFIPHLAITGGIALALCCTATLVWFVHRVATSINIESVIDSVHNDLVATIEGNTSKHPDEGQVTDIKAGDLVSIEGSNYLQALDVEGLAAWAVNQNVRVKLRVRPGDYVPVGFPVAEVIPPCRGAVNALDDALAFGRQPATLQDLEYSVRQLTEIAVRALSPGINDPFTAGSVLERLADVLCRLAGRHLKSGIVRHDGAVALTYPVTTYKGLCDAIFHPIRQSGSASGYVLIRMLDVLIKVSEVEHSEERRNSLAEFGSLTVESGRVHLQDRAALADLEQRFDRLTRIVTTAPPHVRRQEM